MKHVVLGEPHTFCPKRGSVAGDEIKKISGDGDAQPDPRAEVEQVERLFEFGIARAIDHEEGNDARRSDDEQQVKRNQKLDRDERADDDHNEIDDRVKQRIHRKRGADFARGARMRDRQHHGVDTPHRGDEIENFPPTRPETGIAPGAFDGVTEGFITCPSEERTDAPQQQGDPPPETGALTVARL